MKDVLCLMAILHYGNLRVTFTGSIATYRDCLCQQLPHTCYHSHGLAIRYYCQDHTQLGTANATHNYYVNLLIPYLYTLSNTPMHCQLLLHNKFSTSMHSAPLITLCSSFTYPMHGGLLAMY